MPFVTSQKADIQKCDAFNFVIRKRLYSADVSDCTTRGSGGQCITMNVHCNNFVTLYLHRLLFAAVLRASR